MPRRRHRGRRRKKTPGSAFWIILIVLLIMGGAGFWVHSTLFASGRTTETGADPVLPAAGEPEEPGGEEAAGETPLWVPREPLTHTNILLLGLDNQGMADLIMIVSYNMETFESAIISIKRDTYVEEQEWAPKNSGQDHLAWAFNRGMGREGDFHAGANLTAFTVEELLGIDLHAYAAISFDGFVRLVDLIGGVKVEVAPEFALREGTGLPTGLQRLDGSQALLYARHRRNPRIPEPGSESQAGDRVLRNQRLLKAMLEQCKLLGTDELMHIYGRLGEDLHTTLEDWDILELANVLYNRETQDIYSVVLPGEGESVYQERIDRNMYYYFLDCEATDNILRELGLK